MLKKPSLSLVALLLSACAATSTGPSSSATNLDGRVVHYDDHSPSKPGTPIVLVHGACIDNRIWTYNIPGLAEHRRVLSVDLPGHGHSELPSEYSMDVYAAAIAAAMDNAKVERAILVGQSNGVPAIRQFYRHYPERTVALILVDGALREIRDLARFATAVDALETDAYLGAAWNLSEVIRTSQLLTDDRKALLTLSVLSQPQATMIGDLSTRLHPRNIWADDPIDVPVLVLQAPSPAWTEDYEAFVDRLVTGRPFERIEWSDASHILMAEKPLEFNQAVLRFAARVEP